MDRRRSLTLVLLLALGGCYTYSPTAFDSLGGGAEIRIRLSAVEVDRLDDVLPSEGRVVEGAVVERTGGSLFVDVTVASSLQGMRLTSLNQRIQLNRDGVLNLELKTLNRKRTWIASGIAGAAIGFFIYKQFLQDSGGSSSTGGGGPDEGRVRSLQFRLP